MEHERLYFLNFIHDGETWSHLEGSESELKHQTLSLAEVLRGEGEHSVVNPKERNQQQSRAGQPPSKQHTHTHTQKLS